MLARHVLHDGVAAGAGDPALFMNAAGPVIALALLVAGQADAVSLIDRARIVRTERKNAANTASAAQLHVRRTRTMAVLALELAFLRRADLAHHRLLEFGDLGGMAGRASLRAHEMRVDRCRCAAAFRCRSSWW